MKRPLDVERLRTEFPALQREIDGRPVVFLDGPAASQVPRRVIDAVGRYLAETNANVGGAFASSRESDAMLAGARRAVADLLGTDDPQTIVFGPNMTTLTLALARSLARTWGDGDEIVVTRLEHDANFTPWIRAARDAGATVRVVDLRPEDCTLDMEDLRSKIGRRTRFVAVGAASNAVGTVSPVGEVVRWAHDVGARVFVDAVHHAPHLPIDVVDWGCDYLTCSAYKFFGPHVGVLWGRREALEELRPDKLRPASDALPGCWETGGQNHEGIAGTLAAIDYLADVGRRSAGESLARRPALLAAYAAIERHETELSRALLAGMSGIRGLRVHGITEPERLAERVPTVSFTHERLTPADVAEWLGRRGIFVWKGNYYALPVTEALGLEPLGIVRVGLLHYSTRDEVDRLLAALDAL
jgi:cysteine desulfurase family protein (TIGR01976 family)